MKFPVDEYYRGYRVKTKPPVESPPLLPETVPLPQFIVHIAYIAIREYKINDKRMFIHLLEAALDEISKNAKP